MSVIEQDTVDIAVRAAASTPPQQAAFVLDASTGRALAPYSGTDDPRLHVDEVLHVIGQDIANAPRTLQTALGPSEVGHACARRIGYKLLGWPQREQGAAWLPYIGTAVHEQLACAFRAHNAALRAAGGHDRYLVEHGVTVTTPHGRDISGHLDLFDVALGTVIDFKVVGATTLKAARAGKVDAGYRAQIGLYAEGLRRQGHTVARVTVLFLPRNELDVGKAQAWTQAVTHDELEAGAERTLARFDNVADGVEDLGPAALYQLPTHDAHCGFCPYFTPGSRDPMAGCPGAEGLVARNEARAEATVAKVLDAFAGGLPAH